MSETKYRLTKYGEDILATLQPTQLDRIEAQNKEILALLQKKKRVVKPRGTAKSKNVYDLKFQQIWEDYPDTSGSSKVKAYAAYQKRLSEAKGSLELQVNIHIAVINYAAYIKATGRYPKLVETFLGPSRHWENDWTIPKPVAKNGQPEIFSQAHSREGNSVNIADLDPVDPYAELKS